MGKSRKEEPFFLFYLQFFFSFAECHRDGWVTSEVWWKMFEGWWKKNVCHVPGPCHHKSWPAGAGIVCNVSYSSLFISFVWQRYGKRHEKALGRANKKTAKGISMKVVSYLFYFKETLRMTNAPYKSPSIKSKVVGMVSVCIFYFYSTMTLGR